MLSVYSFKQGTFRLVFSVFSILFCFSANAELVPLNESELASAHAQASIELDLEVQTSIDSIIYEDTDGLVVDGQEGQPGVLGLKGVHLGSSKSPITAEQMASDRPFSDGDLAIIENLIIDVDNQEGMRINLERIGDSQGNGLDIIVQHLVLGNEETSGGGILIEDISNFISDDQLARVNALFGSQLSTLDDGLNTSGGNFIPFQSQIITEQTTGNSNLDSTLILPIEIGSDVSIVPGFSASTDMTVNSAFTLSMKKVAWVDDGGEFGVSGLLIYQGIDTNGDGIDDQVGPATLTNLKMKTVNHTSSITGESVQAMHFSNIDFKADIAIESIYVGQPQNSLGSLQIKGLDTSGTEIWMYSH